MDNVQSQRLVCDVDDIGDCYPVGPHDSPSQKCCDELKKQRRCICSFKSGYPELPRVIDALPWRSKKQSCLTDFTMAAEFVALALCYKEAEWLRGLVNKHTLMADTYAANLCAL
ncbi:zinc finger, CCHC-type containing protein [Tanacetum coccineum]